MEPSLGHMQVRQRGTGVRTVAEAAAADADGREILGPENSFFPGGHCDALQGPSRFAQARLPLVHLHQVSLQSALPHTCSTCPVTMALC